MSVNLGRVAYVEKGKYKSDTTYESKDVVSFNGGSYVYIGDTPAANVPPTDEVHWQPLIDPTAMNEKIAEMDGVKQEALTAAATASEKAQEATAAAETANTAAEAADNARLAISDELNKKAPAIFVDASGDMVHITDGAEGMPVQSLITHVEPKQEGSGDHSPDNVRPISGWDSVSVTGAGKNLVNWAAIGSKTNGGVTFTNNGDGTFAVSGETANNAANTDRLTIYLQPGQYKIDSGNDTVLAQIRINRNGTVSNKQNTTFTIYGDETSLMVNLAVAKNKTVSGIVYPLLTMADDAGDYEPYQGQTLTADLPETVYGGTLDWTTGVLTVTHGVRVFTGNEGWQQQDATNTPSLFVIRDYALNGASAHKYTSDCSHFAWDIDLTKNNVHRLAINREGEGVAAYIYVNAASHTTVDDFKAYLAAQYAAGTPVTVVYKLHAPYTIQLTPQQLETLKGVNNIWSNAGETEVTYAADTKLYIDQKIAAIAAAIVNE